MQNITFAPEAFAQFNDWAAQDKDEHRLVYRVTEVEIIILSWRFHYDD